MRIKWPLIVPISIILLPIIGLVYGAITGINGQGQLLSLILPTGRRLDLLIRSMLLSTTISVTSLFVGLFAALLLYKIALKYQRIANTIWRASLFMLLLPSFIHSQAWWNTFEWLGWSTSGFATAWWVSVMFFLPLPFALIFVSLRGIDGEAIEAGTIYLRPGVSLLKVILPSLYPAIFGSGLLVFLLSLADYSIASIFSVNVYTLDIFAQFSVSGSVADALLYSIPLIVITSVIGMIGFTLLRKLVLTAKGEKGIKRIPIALPRSINLLAYVLLAILIMSIAIPCTSLIMNLFRNTEALEHIAMGMEELSNTLVLSLGTVALALPLALTIGVQLNRRELPTVIYFLMALPLVMPSSLIGIGLIGLFNNTGLYNTVLMPILATVARFTPIGAILCYSAFKALEREVRLAQLVYQSSVWHGFYKLLFPMMLPSVLVAGLSIFILSTGEIGATMMVLPPGFNTLAIKIYNYLHFGASDVVALLCSMLVVAVTIMIGTSVFFLSLYRRGR